MARPTYRRIIQLKDSPMKRLENAQIPGISGTPLQAVTPDMNAISKMAQTALFSVCAIDDWCARRV